MIWFVLSVAFAGSELAPVSLSVEGASGVSVQGVEGSVEIVGTDAADVRWSGAVGAGDVALTLKRTEGAIVARAKGKDAQDVALRLEVPRSLLAVTVYDSVGGVTATDLPAALAVVDVAGPVSVTDVGSLRLRDVAGPVTVDGLAGDLLADSVAGPIQARGVRGEVRTTDVAGPVDTEDVAGETVPEADASSTSSF